MSVSAGNTKGLLCCQHHQELMPAGAALHRMPSPIRKMQTSNIERQLLQYYVEFEQDVMPQNGSKMRQWTQEVESCHVTRAQADKTTFVTHMHPVIKTQDVILTNAPWLQQPPTTCGRRQCCGCWRGGFARGWCWCLCRALGLQQAACRCGEGCRCWHWCLAWGWCWCMCRALGL